MNSLTVLDLPGSYMRIYEQVVSEALQPSQTDSYSGKIHSQNQQGKCTDAYYDYLKVYRNTNWHRPFYNTDT